MNTARPSALLFLTCAVSTLPLQMTASAFGQSATNPQTAAQTAPLPKEKPPMLASSYSRLPLSFEANQGQTDPQVRFLSRGQGYSLFLTDSAAVLALSRPNPRPNNGSNAIAAKANAAKPAQSDVVRMELAGANPAAHVAGAEQLPGIANYFLGKDPSSWHTNVPTYAKVNYSSVYPGVDLVYYGNQRQLEYDFLVAPNANPKQVRLHFAGAKRLSVKPDGDLTVTARHGEVAFHKPAVYQTVNGQRHAVEGRFTLLAGNKVGFLLGNYDHCRELVIDPVLVYSTYLGGSGYQFGNGDTFGDVANGIAVDSSGDVYVAGVTYSSDFPTTSGAFQTTNPLYGSSLGFVTKLNPSGSALVYSTYLALGAEVFGIAVDSQGYAYVAGATTYAGFPVTKGAFQTMIEAEQQNGFVTKLSPTGSDLVYSTFLSGQSYGSRISAIAVDKSGIAYVTGTTPSPDFPVTQGAFQTVKKGFGGIGNPFITKLNSQGTGLIYSTFLGGSGGSDFPQPPDEGFGIAVDGDGNAYVAGLTGSTDFPITSGAFQKVNHTPMGGSGYNGFFTEINASGSALIYSTYLGGAHPGFDQANAVAVDNSGYAYVTGLTRSTDFPVTPGAYQTMNQGQSIAGFVAKFQPSNSSLVYSTFLGGGSGNFAPGIVNPGGGNGIAVDPLGNAYVTGSTTSTDFPVTSNAFQQQNNGVGNAFLTELNSSGTGLLYSSYLGGQTAYGADAAHAIAMDASGNIYLAGAAYSADFPVTNDAFQRENNAAAIDSTNAFITKFDFSQNPTIIDTSVDLISGNLTGDSLGQLLTFLASVNSINLSSIPGGNVVFSVDGVAQQTVPLLHDGHAVYYNSSLTAGSHQVTATYQGNAQYAPSSQTVTQTILNQAVTPTILPPSGTYRTVQAVISTPTPNAAIYYTTDGSVPTASSHRYTGPIPILISGVIRAIAVADGGFPSLTTATSKYLLQPFAISTATSIQASATQLPSGQPVTFTATVKFASGPIPPGNVIFMDGAVAIANVPLQGSQATFTTSALGIGGHSITAFYPGVPANPAIPYQGSLVSQSPALVLGVTP